MDLPKYMYPKFYNYSLSKYNKEIIEPKDIRLFKNLKLSKDFKNIEKIHLDQYHINKDTWSEKYQNLSKEDYKRENEYFLLDFIDIFKKQYWISKKYNLGNGFSNAFRKIYEVCYLTDFIKKGDNSKVLKHFDICGFPGAFILGINYFINTQTSIKNYDWYIQSYVKDKGEKNYFTDEFGLAKKYPSHFLSGPSKGDITKRKSIEYYFSFFEKEKRDIVTSDCGLGFRELWDSEKGYGREKQMMKTFFSQFVCGLGVLKRGGNFFMKTYHSFSPFMISLVYLMGCLFEKVNLVKPESSRQPGGKEIYILCKKLKNEPDVKFKNKLLDILENFTENDLEKNILSSNKIDKEVLKNIEEGFIKYYINKLHIRELSNDFIINLVGVDIFERPEEYFQIKDELKKELNPIMVRYVNNYLKKMKYKKIKNEDKLI